MPRKKPNYYRHPKSLDDLTAQNISAIIKLDDTASANRSGADRIADLIAGFCGSMNFVRLHIIWFGGWIALNLLPGMKHFDPFPYTFLTLIVSLEAIFLSTFILISENHSSRLSERRNHLDLQINLLAEQENTKILNLLHQIADKLGIEADQNPSTQVLDEAMQPEKLAAQIDTAIDRGAAKGGKSK